MKNKDGLEIGNINIMSLTKHKIRLENYQEASKFTKHIIRLENYQEASKFT